MATYRSNPHQEDTYRRWYQVSAQFHKFSFSYRPSNPFTGAQKAAITRLYHGVKPRYDLMGWQTNVGVAKPGLGRLATHIKEGRAVFKKVSKASTRSALSKRFRTTNKGLAIYGKNTEKIIIKGKGKKALIRIYKPQQTELYIPKDPDEPIQELVDRVLKDYAPNWIVLAVGRYRGTQAYNAKKFAKYKEDLKTLEEEIMSGWGLTYDETPFNGVYAVYK